MTREIIIEKLEKKRESLGEKVSAGLRFPLLVKIANVVDPEKDADLWSNFTDVVGSLPDSLPLEEKEMRTQTKRISSLLSSVLKRKGLLRDYYYTRIACICGFIITILVSLIFKVEVWIALGSTLIVSLFIGTMLDMRARKMGRTL